MTRSVELKLYAYRKNKDGLIVSFVVHPNDEPNLYGVDIGDVFQAVLEEGSDTSIGGIDDTQQHRNNNNKHNNRTNEITEGERLRTRAVMLCKDPQFQVWATSQDGVHYLEPNEQNAAIMLREICGIDSRSELALSIPGQEKFRYMEQKYREETGQTAERRGG